MTKERRKREKPETTREPEPFVASVVQCPNCGEQSFTLREDGSWSCSECGLEENKPD